MPRRKRKNRTERSERLREALYEKQVISGDVAISDFANAEDAKEALKRISRRLAANAASLVCKHEKEDIVPWYERTDFDSEVEDEDEDEDEEKPTEEEKNRSTLTGRKKNVNLKAVVNGESSDDTVTYPLDVWCLLAQYIGPEHVQSFALICKGARDAINTRTFWLRLYNRHISHHKNLPERLRPERIECRPGLRARIIRALFHGYDPLRTRMTSKFGTVDASVLESRMCISMWYKQGICKKQTKKIWVFYFKFSRKSFGAKRLPIYFSPRWFAQVDDLNYNPEQYNSVLQVNCVNFLPLAPVQGHVLTRALVGISRDMSHNSVKLTFHSPRSDGRYLKENATSVVLDPVYDVKVLYWWSPGYPRQGHEL